MANYPQSVQGGRSLRFCVLSALWESSRVYGYGGRRYLYSQRPRRPCLVKKRSTDLLHDPWYNKVVSSISRAFKNTQMNHSTCHWVRLSLCQSILSGHMETNLYAPYYDITTSVTSLSSKRFPESIISI